MRQFTRIREGNIRGQSQTEVVALRLNRCACADKTGGRKEEVLHEMGIARGVFHLCNDSKLIRGFETFTTKTMPMLTSQCLRPPALALLLCCAGMAFFGCGKERNFHVPASAFDSDVPEPVDVRAVMALGDFDAWQSATGAFGYAYTEDILRIGAGAVKQWLQQAVEQRAPHASGGPAEGLLGTVIRAFERP